MSGRTALRFAIEAAFLVGVAAVVAALELSVPVILVAIFAAWAVAASFEWGVTRGRIGLRPRPATRTPSAPRGRHRPAASATGGGLLARLGRPSERPVPAEPVSEGGEAPGAEEEPQRLPEPQPGPVHEPEPAIVQESGVPPEEPVEIPAAAAGSSTDGAEAASTDGGKAPTEAEPPAAEEPAPEPPRPAPVLTAVPALPPEPQPEPEPAPAAEPDPAASVVPLTPRGPREWNLWDLERLTRAAAGRDAFRDEERAYLLVYLREFADPAGILPVDFDGLVRESFGELVGTG